MFSSVTITDPTSLVFIPTYCQITGRISGLSGNEVIRGQPQGQKGQELIYGVTKEVTKISYELGLCQAKKEKKYIPGRRKKLLNRKLAQDFDCRR